MHEYFTLTLTYNIGLLLQYEKHIHTVGFDNNSTETNYFMGGVGACPWTNLQNSKNCRQNV